MKNKIIFITGLLFASLASASYSPRSIICDPTVNTRCASVDSSGRISIDGSSVTQPISASALPLPTGAATQTTLASILTALGSPFQAGGSIGNTSFGISGTLPAFAATPTFNLGTLNGAATAANQSTEITALNQIHSDLIAPLPAGTNAIGSITNTGFVANAGTNLNTSALALESGGNLASINTKTPSLGQAAMSASRPVAIASDQSTLNVVLPDVTVTGQSAQTATVNNIIPATSSANATDATGYHSASIQVVSTGTGGTFIFEGSNDNSNFQTIPVYSQLVLTGTPITAAITASASQLVYTFPVTVRYIRLRIATTITGGSIQAFTRLSQATWTPAVFQVAQGTGTNLNAVVASGTVTTVSTLTTLANGQTAHSSASTGSPLRVGGRVVTTLDTTLAQGDASDLAVTTGQQLVNKPFASSENDWQASSGTTPLATTTSTALKAAGAASIRNFVTGCQFTNSSSTVSTTVSILDGAAVIWTGYLPATTAALPVVPVNVTFLTPLRGTAATAMNVQLGTTSASVYYNCQGYQSF